MHHRGRSSEMTDQIDFYSILGVLPDAEDTVIRAAYKALAQKYHPDRFSNQEEAARRMSEVNQAYEVLGDPKRRRQYDESRATLNGSSYSEVSDDEEIVFDQSQKDWLLACEFYPDLAYIRDNLKKTSNRLALTYMLHMLETKNFDQRAKLAVEMESRFLQKYFGSNQEILGFARNLIKKGNRAALIYLNNSIRVLGESVSPRMIIAKIIDQFSDQKCTKFTDDELSAALPFWSEFRWAIVRGDKETVKNLMFKAPALIVVRDAEGNTCLHFATQESQHEMVQLFLENGANPETSNHYQTTPLELARGSKSEKIKSAFRMAGCET